MQADIDSRRIGMLFACLITAAALRAQPPAIHSENGVYTLHEDTHLVLLDVTVTDKKGHPVPGLTKDDFKLLEDGQPQTIKFFEEHAPVDSAEIARQKAAAMAGQPPNTFTNYEPFTGRPVTVLLLNELFPMGDYDLLPLYQQMLKLLQSAPPDTPFVLYLLDSELRLVQPVTTDRALLLAKIELLWKTPHFGSEAMINPQGKISRTGRAPAGDIPVRRRFTTDAMQQLASSLKEEPGRKNLIFFTGGFQCAVVGSPGCPEIKFPNDSMEYLCGLVNTLEQGRMSIYRNYPRGEIDYGFGCRSAPADLKDIFVSHYYTLYYTPDNTDWNGKYRATTLEVADKGLHLAYRQGYYGTPGNVEAHYYTAKAPAPEPVAPDSGGTTIAATAVDEGSPTPSHLAPLLKHRTPDSTSLHTSTPPTAPNPASAVFSVQVIPADKTVVPPPSTSPDQDQEYRQLTLRFSMPSSEFKVMPSGAAGQYIARLQISAVAYAEGRLAPTNGSQAVQMVVNFDGATDPRIAKSTVTATLTVNILEHAKNRWLGLTVRDLATGQFGSLVVPMEQVKLPGL